MVWFVRFGSAINVFEPGKNEIQRDFKGLLSPADSSYSEMAVAEDSKVSTVVLGGTFDRLMALC